MAGKKIEKKCPSCEQLFVTRWDRQVCCTRTCARRLQAKVHGPGGWKGGVNRINTGYLKQIAKGHPYADKNGYVLQHRLVMEGVIGRHLTPGERVHHKNGKRDDNRPENLELWVGAASKDPHGVRLVDKVLDMIDSLTAAERERVLCRLQEKAQECRTNE